MSVDSVIPGFVMIRKLGEGRRAEVHLARLLDDSARDGADDARSTPTTVALKLYRPTVQQHDWLTEIEALERSAGEHVLGLIDVATTTADRTALVVERLESTSLGTLLEQRQQLSIGEAITITAPIVEAINRMHSVGVAHGAIGPQSLLFSRDGAPVLARFGSAKLVEPLMPRARRAGQPLLIRDISATVDLVTSVLQCVPSDRLVRGVLDWLEELFQEESPDVLTELTGRLFDLGDPGPVLFDESFEGEAAEPALEVWKKSTNSPQPAPASRIIGMATGPNPSLGGSTGPHSRLAPASGRSHRSSDPPHAERGRFNVPAAAVLLLPTWLIEQVDGWLAEGSPLARLRSTVKRRLPSRFVERLTVVKAALAAVRPRVWLTAGATVIATLIVVNVVLYPSVNNPGVDSPISRELEGTGGAGQIPANEPIALEDSPDRASSTDDPVTAALELAATRERCIRDRSVLCLDGVSQLGSAALSTDQELVRELQTGAELPASWSLNTDNVRVIERLGDSVLLQVTGRGSAPTTILMMKGEAGWRFRDYVP